ncbi:M23 family metallopeptidase [Parasulfuritortus cantonensis]|uniref:M23 family metallopeptidase n=1 Tax=Parasulfuritortus cantonensis TaxID=2528202 RepID=A0A4R1B871_9PROT|nr:M23 family metallopeptidase [Parasulfuritortus cantonensis]TCJ12223.1 M23 family metallopeptidase [Parasulfuritortus cantonensis]
MTGRRRRRLAVAVAALLVLESLLPAGGVAMPVAGAGRRDWNPASYWYAPWGESGVHKGIDIFARRGTPVRAAQAGLVVYRGEIARGGKVVLVLTARGWLHYYAHLGTLGAESGHWLATGDPVGTVGDSGNARGKPPHLHYAVVTLVPRPWAARPGAQGWKAMFYRDPGRLLP